VQPKILQTSTLDVDMKTLRWVYVFTGVECLSQVAYLVNRFPSLHCSGMFMEFFSNHGLNAAKRSPMWCAFPACYVRLCAIVAMNGKDLHIYLCYKSIHCQVTLATLCARFGKVKWSWRITVQDVSFSFWVHFSSKEHILKVHTYVDINHFTYMSHTSHSVATGLVAITDQLGEA